MENIVTEFCPHCETEVEMSWDVKALGHKAYCPHCGKRLMLCDACQHPDGEHVDNCDYCSATDTCRHNLTNKELDYESNMEALVNKLQNEMEEYEGRLADLLDKENAQTTQHSVYILGDRLTSWFIKRRILGHFTYEALYCEYDVDREIRNQKLLKVKDLLHRLYIAYDDIDTEVELAIPSVIEKAIEQVLEEECAND